MPSAPLPPRRSPLRPRRALALSGGVIAAVWAFRGFLAVLTPDNPNPYLNPLAVGITLLVLALPLLRTARFGRSRLADGVLVLGTALVVSAAALEALPVEGAGHRVALATHLTLGLLALLPVHLYLATHLREAIRRRPLPLIRGGILALIGLLLCVWTGALLLLVQAREMEPLAAPHRWLGWALVILLIAHVRSGRAVLRRRGNHPSVGRRAALAIVAGVALGLGPQILPHERGPGAWEAPAGAFGRTDLTAARSAHGGLLADGPWTWSPATCSSSGGYCHVDTLRQWARSGHARSDNPAYRLALAAFSEDRPGQERYCRGCHQPRRALSDAPDAELAEVAAAQGWTIGQPPEDPASPDGPPFGFELADGVGCVVCHRATPRADAEGTGSYVLAPTPASLVRTAALPFLNFPMILSDLERHRRDFSPPSLADETGCATCHRHRVPDAVHPAIRGLMAADKVGPWRARQRWKDERCQHCHMPRVYGPVDPTWTRSHAFPSGNTGLPAARSDGARVLEQQDFVADRLFLSASCQPVEQGAERARLRCSVGVENRGVGHRWPAGPRDLVEAWLAVDLLDADGVPLVSRGVLGPGRQVIDPLMDWRQRLFDAAGAPLLRHQFWRVARVEGRAPIEPLATDLQGVVIELPPELADAVRVASFRLLERRYHADFAVLAFGPTLELPTTELAALRVALPER